MKHHFWTLYQTALLMSKPERGEDGRKHKKTGYCVDFGNLWHMAKQVKWKIEDLERLKADGKIQGWVDRSPKEESVKVRSPKYRNTATMVNGIRFDSKKEAKDYKNLLLLLKAGKIGQLQLQVPFELNQGGTHSYKYVADFTYIDAETGEYVVADSKGFRTKEYIKKRRLMKKVHGIAIREF